MQRKRMESRTLRTFFYGKYVKVDPIQCQYILLNPVDDKTGVIVDTTRIPPNLGICAYNGTVKCQFCKRAAAVTLEEPNGRPRLF